MAFEPSTVPPQLHGTLPALVTPLTPQRRLALDDTATLVHRAIDEGANGVLVAGSTGEGALLDPELRVALTERARVELDNRPQGDADPTPLLVAGACASTLAGLHADVSRLAAAGADVVLVLAPATYPLRSHELEALHLDIAERAEAPTLIYHIPQITGSSLEPEAVDRLAAHERIIGMKDSSPDAQRRARFVAAAERATGSFAVVSGHAPTLRDALEAGVTGSILAVANVRQRQAVGLHAAVAAGDQEQAGELQRRLTATTEGLQRVGRSTQAALKAALQLEGVIAERWCVPPLDSVPPDQLDLVRTAMLS